MSDIPKLVEGLLENPYYARKVERAAKIDTRLAAVATDDGVSVPAAPTGALYYSSGRAIEFIWNPPATADHVAHARLWYAVGTTTVTPPASANVDPTDSGNIGFVQQIDGNTFTDTGWTPGDPIRAFVQFENIWGRRGPWADLGANTVVGTVLDVPADAIDLGAVTFSNKLFADYIAAGTINTGTITVASTITINATGSLTAQSVSLDANGIALTARATSRATAFPTFTLGDWLNSGPSPSALPSPFGGIGFFSDTTNGVRGMAIRASGINTGTMNGEIVISADYGNQSPNANSTAKIRMTSSHSAKASTELQGDVIALDDVSINGDFFASKNTGTLTPTSGPPGWSNTGGNPMVATRTGNIVSLQGQPTAIGTITSTTNLNNSALPFEYIPSTTRAFLVPMTSGGSWISRSVIVVDSSGNIHTKAGAANQPAAGEQISLDGVTYTTN